MITAYTNSHTFTVCFILLLLFITLAFSTYYKFSFHHFVLRLTEDDRSLCLNMFQKLKLFVVCFLKILHLSVFKYLLLSRFSYRNLIKLLNSSPIYFFTLLNVSDIECIRTLTRLWVIFHLLNTLSLHPLHVCISRKKI